MKDDGQKNMKVFINNKLAFTIDRGQEAFHIMIDSVDPAKKTADEVVKAIEKRFGKPADKVIAFLAALGFAGTMTSLTVMNKMSYIFEEVFTLHIQQFALIDALGLSFIVAALLGLLPVLLGYLDVAQILWNSKRWMTAINYFVKKI